MGDQFDDIGRMAQSAPDNQCWIWPHFTDRWGYGVVWSNSKNRRVHRIAYELYVENIPDGMVVRHSCDKPACFNPKHLEIGTHADNVGDRVVRGRSASGSANGRSKLDDAKARAIFLSVNPVKALAREYGVDPRAIRQIRERTTWREATADLVGGG